MYRRYACDAVESKLVPILGQSLSMPVCQRDAAVGVHVDPKTFNMKYKQDAKFEMLADMSLLYWSPAHEKRR